MTGVSRPVSSPAPPHTGTKTISEQVFARWDAAFEAFAPVLVQVDIDAQHEHEWNRFCAHVSQHMGLNTEQISSDPGDGHGTLTYFYTPNMADHLMYVLVLNGCSQGLQVRFPDTDRGRQLAGKYGARLRNAVLRRRLLLPWPAPAPQAPVCAQQDLFGVLNTEPRPAGPDDLSLPMPGVVQYSRSGDLSDAEWNTLTRLAVNVIDFTAIPIVGVSGRHGTFPDLLEEDAVRLNGLGEDRGEGFVFTRKERPAEERNEHDEASPHNLEWVVTGGRPYTRVVLKILALAEEVSGGRVRLRGPDDRLAPFRTWAVAAAAPVHRTGN